MIDVIDVRIGLLGAEIEDVADDRQEVLRPDRLLLFADLLEGRVLLKLAVDAEAADLPKAIAVLVEELLLEQGAGLVNLRRIARTQATVDAEKRCLVLVDFGQEVQALNGERVEDQRITRVGDGAHRLEARGLDRLKCRAERHADLAQLLAGLLINDQLCGEVLRLEFLDLDVLNVVEQFEDLVGRGETLIEGAQEGGGGDLCALVDAHRQNVLLGDLEFDPRAALGNDAGRVQRAIADRRRNAEVDARRAVQLADDDALGAVDDELAAAHDDRDLAEVDFLLDDLGMALTHQAHADAERHAVGQAQFAALVGRVACLVELVMKVLQAHRAVVRLDGEDLAQKRFESDLRIAPVVGFFVLDEAVVRFELDLGLSGHGDRVAALFEVANLQLGHQFTSMPIRIASRNRGSRFSAILPGFRCGETVACAESVILAGR